MPSRCYKPYNTEEDEFIREKYGTISVDAIAKHLERTRMGIVGYIKKNKIPTPKENKGYLSLNEICKKAKWSYTDFIKFANKNKCPYIRIYSGTTSRKIKVIDSEDFWKWIEPYKSKFSFEFIDEYFLLPHPEWLKQEKNKSNRRRLWTKEEERKLRTLLKMKRSTKYISKNLNRSKSSINNKANKLNIKIERERNWTSSEINFMINELLKGELKKDIAIKLNKRPRDIYSKLHYLKKTNDVRINKLKEKEEISKNNKV